MQSLVIDLRDYTSAGIGIIAGRDLGEGARKKFGLDKLDARPEDAVTVEIRIPDEVFSINSSFWLGMFARSVRSLGERGFRQRFKFMGRIAERVVDEGIRKSLRSVSPLPDVRR